MIGYLSGKIINKFTDSIILSVNDVGYKVLVCPSCFVSLPEKSLLNLFIHTHVREDTLDLYGFKTKEELTLFEMLLSVSGVGPKTALLVVDRGVEPVQNAIVSANVDFFTTIPRLGQKNAQKIIIELKNKLGGFVDLDLASQTKETQDAVEALIAIGYNKKDALAGLKGIPSSEKTIEQKIKFALKNLGKRDLK